MSAKTSLCADHGFGSLPQEIPEPPRRHRIDGLDQVWIADITYLRLPTTFCYLAAILDAYSRRCVGWHLSRFIDASLTLSALEMALASRRPAVGLIHHSDRGVRYASSEYVLRLEQAGARISMAAVPASFSLSQISTLSWLGS